jgi:hypothetical protein
MRAVTFCSFATDKECLGIVILENALDPFRAILRIHKLQLDPGGELMTYGCFEKDPDCYIPDDIFEAMWNNMNRLIPIEDAKKLFDLVPINCQPNEVSFSCKESEIGYEN